MERSIEEWIKEVGSLRIRVAQLETAAANDSSGFESAPTAATSSKSEGQQ